LVISLFVAVMADCRWGRLVWLWFGEWAQGQGLWLLLELGDLEGFAAVAAVVAVAGGF